MTQLDKQAEMAFILEFKSATIHQGQQTASECFINVITSHFSVCKHACENWAALSLTSM